MFYFIFSTSSRRWPWFTINQPQPTAGTQDVLQKPERHWSALSPGGTEPPSPHVWSRSANPLIASAALKHPIYYVGSERKAVYNSLALCLGYWVGLGARKDQGENFFWCFALSASGSLSQGALVLGHLCIPCLELAPAALSCFSPPNPGAAFVAGGGNPKAAVGGGRCFWFCCVALCGRAEKGSWGAAVLSPWPGRFGCRGRQGSPARGPDAGSIATCQKSSADSIFRHLTPASRSCPFYPGRRHMPQDPLGHLVPASSR